MNTTNDDGCDNVGVVEGESVDRTEGVVEGGGDDGADDGNGVCWFCGLATVHEHCRFIYVWSVYDACYVCGADVEWFDTILIAFTEVPVISYMRFAAVCGKDQLAAYARGTQPFLTLADIDAALRCVAPGTDALSVHDAVRDLRSATVEGKRSWELKLVVSAVAELRAYDHAWLRTNTFVCNTLETLGVVLDTSAMIVALDTTKKASAAVRGYGLDPEALTGAYVTVHARWDAVGGGTNRLVSRSPCLQNIPKTPVAGVSPRDWVDPGPGRVRVSFDYRSIEVCVSAALSRDTRLCRLVADTLGDDGDVFARLAERLISGDAAMPRDIVKQIVYGMLFGMGQKTMTTRYALPPSAYQGYMKRVRAVFPQWHAFMTHRPALPACARIPGCSRVRRVGKAHVYINTLVQGAAAVIFNAAAERVMRALHYDPALAGCSPLNILYDEIVLAVPAERGRCERAIAAVRALMIKVTSMAPDGLYLAVEHKISPTTVRGPKTQAPLHCIDELE